MKEKEAVVLVKLGVFGGRRGDCMIDWCEKTGRAQVVAICDRDETVTDRLKNKYPEHGIAYYTSFEDFLAHGLDAVILANYATEHAPYAVRCLDAGLHVLSEVLPCLNMSEAVALVEAVERTGKIYAYAENYCYMPAPREMRRLYRSGKLGTFEYGEGEYVHNCEPIWPNITYGDKTHWRNNIYVNYYCTHSLGPLIHITGLRPVSVTGFELPFTDACARMGVRAGVAGLELVTLSNGTVVRSLHGKLNKNSIWYCIYGSRGRAESAREDAEMQDVSRIYVNLDEKEGVYRNTPQTYEPKDSLSDRAKEAGHGSSDYYVMHNFISAVEGDRDAEIIDVYEALDMSMPGLFAYYSVLNGGIPQAIPDLRDKNEREKYRNDKRCTDRAVAGDMWIPSYSKGDIEIPDTVYDRIREQYKKTLEEETK